MKCQSCEVNDAKLHFTKIIDGKLEEKHLCEECAAKDSDFDFTTPFTGPFSVHKLFSGLFNDFTTSHQDLKREEGECRNCGLNYREFRRTGKFGCSECYNTFGNRLPRLFRGIHNAEVHTGKIPGTDSEELKLEKDRSDLKKRLKKLVENEEFEEAAVVRDKIKALDEKINMEKEKKKDKEE